MPSTMLLMGLSVFFAMDDAGMTLHCLPTLAFCRCFADDISEVFFVSPVRFTGWTPSLLYIHVKLVFEIVIWAQTPLQLTYRTESLLSDMGDVSQLHSTRRWRSTLKWQATATASACNFHLKGVQALPQLRSCLPRDVAQSVACAIIGSRLDYCNSLYYARYKFVTYLLTIKKRCSLTARFGILFDFVSFHGLKAYSF